MRSRVWRLGGVYGPITLPDEGNDKCGYRLGIEAVRGRIGVRSRQVRSLGSASSLAKAEPHALGTRVLLEVDNGGRKGADTAKSGPGPGARVGFQRGAPLWSAAGGAVGVPCTRSAAEYHSIVGPRRRAHWFPTP